jgi:hypothetical protein
MARWQFMVLYSGPFEIKFISEVFSRDSRNAFTLLTVCKLGVKSGGYPGSVSIKRKKSLRFSRENYTPEQRVWSLFDNDRQKEKTFCTVFRSMVRKFSIFFHILHHSVL